jgi:hypothetical protein
VVHELALVYWRISCALVVLVVSFSSLLVRVRYHIAPPCVRVRVVCVATPSTCCYFGYVAVSVVVVVVLVCRCGCGCTAERVAVVVVVVVAAVAVLQHMTRVWRLAC